MPRYQLISFELCPYVQRSVIALEEKGVAYEIEYIDLGAKPDWFLEISPFGKVPVLRADDTVLFESAVINEYLDEVAGERRLHPSDPLERAYNRAWIEFGSALLADVYRLMVADSEPRAREAAAKARDKLERFERQLGPGPYFNGSEFSLVDAALAPALLRIVWMHELAPELGLTDELPKLRAWCEALFARESVRRSIFPGMRDKFIEYLAGKRAPSKTTEPSWLGRQRATTSSR